MTLRWRERVLVYFVPLCLLYLVTMWALWRVPNTYWGMYGNIDGMWSAWNVEAIFAWGKVFDLSPFNPLSGMGSMFLPNLPWLNPAALSLGLPLPRELNYFLSYTVYFAELCASHIILFRLLGLSPLRSVMAAQVYLLVLFPPSSAPFVAQPWYSLAPVYAHLAAVANLILALFLVTGRYQHWGNMACTAGILILSVAGLCSAPIHFLAYVPAYGLAAMGLLLELRPDRRTLLWKLGAVATTAGVLVLLGFPDYLRAMGEMSARSAFRPAFADGPAVLTLSYWRSVWRQFDVCAWPHELLCRRFPIFWFQILAMLGAGIQLLKGRSLLRPLAACFLLYGAFTHLNALAGTVALFGKLHVLSTGHLVWASYTFTALFFVVFAFAPIDLVRRARSRWVSVRPRKSAPGEGSLRVLGRAVRSWQGRRIVAGGLLSLVVPGLALYLWVARTAPHVPRRPKTHAVGLLGRSPVRRPVVGPVTGYLVEHAGLQPGAIFHGYTTNYFGDPAGHIREAVGYREPRMSRDIYVRALHYLDDHYGNYFQWMDLWAFNIPTFEEYGQWVTRQAYVFAGELFSSPGDRSDVRVLHIYKLEIPLLQALGVRFIITDLRLADPRLTLRARERALTAGPIYLYELAEPNLATYSPTRPIKATTFADALGLIRQQEEALRTVVVVFEDLPGPFLPARDATLRMERDGFRITAVSDGSSLVLVPVQFSRCFRMRPARPEGGLTGARLLRANAIQTLVEFQGRLDAQVRFDFGLLGAARCRFQDARELDALGLKR